MKSRKSVSAVLMLTVIIVLLAACGQNQPAENPAPRNASGADAASTDAGSSDKAPEPFTIRIGNNGGSNQLKLAYYKGWFEEEFAKINGKVEYAEFQSGPQAIEAMAAGRLDVTSLVDGGVITAVTGKVDVKLVSYLSSGLKGVNYVLVPKGSGIKQLSDLKGKRVALPKGTTNHVFFVKALQQAGLKESDVHIVNLLIPDAQPAFESGQLDAWVTADPFAYQEVQVNGASVIASGESLNIPAPVFAVFHAKFAERHPEAVKAYLRVVRRAVEFEKENYEEAIQLYAELKNQDAALVKVLADNYEARIDAIPDPIVEEFQKTADLLLELGFLKEKIDVFPLVDNAYIQDL